MRSLLRSLTIFILIFSSSCSSAPDAHYSDLDYRGLFAPVFLNFDESDTINVEPIPHELKIDSIHAEHFSLNYSNSILSIVKPEHSTPFLTNCIVYQDGIPLGFPLIHGVEQSDKSFITPLNHKGPYLELLVRDSKEILAYWNNLKLNTENNEDTIKVIIPPFAKYTEHSHITVYAVNDKGKYDHAIIPIRKGKIIQDISKLRKPLVEDGAPINCSRLYALGNTNYYPMINKFLQSEVELPTSLSGIYGQYSKIKEDTALLVLQANYYQDRSLLLFNRSGDQIIDSLNNDTVTVKPYSFVLKKITQ